MNVRQATRRLRRWGAAIANKLIGGLAVAVLIAFRRLDPNRSIEMAARFMRRVGRFLPENRVGRENLKAAFPEKTSAEIDDILREVWANLGRVGAEFAHLDRLWDIDLEHPERGRIDFSKGDVERFLRVRSSGKPAMAFTAHYGNWELTAVAAAAYGIEGAVLYRAPNIRAVDRFVRRIRAANMGILVRAGLDAPLRLVDLLRRGISVGMLVDQHYSKGVDVTFFGRRCKANPLIARLARQIECPIYGARMTRLPNNRFRAELTEPIEPVRDAEGGIDVAGTMQVITDVLEGWIREHPEQWLWLHRRWR
jgi:Kdo2-lipid IVA lauroyltransferase/acyltransferase